MGLWSGNKRRDRQNGRRDNYLGLGVFLAFIFCQRVARISGNLERGLDSIYKVIRKSYGDLRVLPPPSYPENNEVSLFISYQIIYNLS